MDTSDIREHSKSEHNGSTDDSNASHSNPNATKESLIEQTGKSSTHNTTDTDNSDAFKASRSSIAERGSDSISLTIYQSESNNSPQQHGLDLTADYKEPFDLRKSLCNKGTLSNLITFIIMIVGLIAISVSDAQFPKYVLALGLFGFAGGTTNWLAVKMLFDKIPFLYGSGVIPHKFKEIRETMKSMIMATFFDEEYLHTYLSSRASKLLHEKKDVILQKVNEALESNETDELIQTKISELIQQGDATATLLNMAMFTVGGGTPAGMVPHLKPLILSFGQEAVNMLITKFDSRSFIDIPSVRAEIDTLLSEKLLQLTPVRVKNLMEQVIRDHLGWLVVWGNVFGGLIGVISQAAGFGA